MATLPASSQVPVEQYQRTPELFDRHEFVDGRLIEKALPTRRHSLLQGWFSVLFWRSYPSLQAGPQLHSKLRQSLWRIPDFAVQTHEAAAGEVYAVVPLLLVIEILSPEDRLGDVQSKMREYRTWGVPYCWVFDPENERAWTLGRSNDLEEVTGRESITAGDIQFGLSEIFSVLHRAN